MRARITRNAYIDGVFYNSPGVFDFPDGTVLPASAEEVDPAEVPADELAGSIGDRSALQQESQAAISLREMAQSEARKIAKEMFEQYKAELAA